MASTDDVNAQHLAAMGLAGQPLGQEATPVPSARKDRCPSINPATGNMCILPPGHPHNQHVRGRERWNPEPEPLSEVFTLSCDDAKAHRQHDRHTYSVGEIEHTCPGYGPVSEERRQELLSMVRSTTGSPVRLPQAPTKQREGDQALPKPGQECVQDLVIAEMQESKRVGMERYGSTLQTFNGRRSIQDVAEEVRDLHVYIKQVEREAQADRDTLVGIVRKALVDAEEANRRVVFGPDVSPISRAFAEAAVDAIMGWVVGQDQARRFRDGEDVYLTLVDGAWGKGASRMMHELNAAQRALIEAQTHAIMDRLGIGDADG